MAVRFRAIGIRLLGALGLVGWLLAAFGGEVPAVQAQAGAVSRLEIVAIDTSRFPETVVTFKAFDGDGRPILGLTDFRLLEDGQEVDPSGPPVEVEQPAPISLMALIDQGEFSILRYRDYYEPAALKALFELLGNQYLREGDTVCLAAARHDTATGSQQLQFLTECAPFPATYSQALAGLDLELAASFPARDPRADIHDVLHKGLFQDALAALAGRPNPIIVFLSANVRQDQWPETSQMAAERIVQDAGAAGARIFVLQAAGNTVNPNNPAQVAEILTPMITLAESSGGQYVALRPAQDNLEEAQAAFDALRPVDHVYSLTYRSANGTTGERRIAVAPAAQPEVAAERAVTLNLLPPAVDEAALEIGPARGGRRELVVPIAWPDGSPREIRAVTVDGEAVEEYEYADGALRFTLDESATGDLRVVVEDELGLSAEFVAPIATPVPPTATPVPATPTPIPEPAAPIEEDNPVAGALPWIGLGGVIAAGAAGLYVARRRGALAGPGRGSGQGASPVKTIGTARDQKQALAYLLVLTGREDLIGQNIALYNEITTIGRDPQLTDIQLYHPHELSSISGQHCTIQVDHGLFLLIDNNSANGTFVNGAALMPDMPHQLQDGDEIVLGDKAQRGAQLRFEVSQRARNRYYETVVETDWQGGDRSGTDTVTGPARPADLWSDTTPLAPADGAAGPLPDPPPADDQTQPPATGSAN